MKIKLIGLVIGLLMTMSVFAIPNGIVKGMYFSGYIGDRFIPKYPALKEKKLKTPKDYPFSDGFYDMELNVPYIVTCTYYSPDYQYGERLPITLHWKGFDESNMIYYENNMKVHPKQADGKTFLNLENQYGRFSIQNVVKTEYDTDLDLDFDNSEHALLYYCNIYKQS